ncbi:polymorphic toxin type 23 domain-containing protein [Capnocytophaga sputigena]|uniref:polymorphic toxin type 23 domain-containing protein n=1 Tax=Capnocytophaga sputigena TaxID=1019 RepID=UPI002889B89C|nr:polymorphic toxin type 23 domain-containing protein [Capnocytophaga sputigena]
MYNAFGERSHCYYGNAEVEKAKRLLLKHYSHDGSVEIVCNKTDNSTKFVFYLGGDAYSAPAILISDGEVQKLYYLHRDYLGSIVMLTDEEGNIAERRHFDPWGQPIRVEDGAGNTLDKLTLLDRGFTGHEHLQTVGLIHMNGRLYDPALHRFLQPDNFVQDPFNTQNFNRYGYCLNNPLVYVDENGEIIQWLPILAGALLGAYSSGVAANNGEYNLFKWNYSDSWGSILGGAIMGAANGYLAQLSGATYALGKTGFTIGITPQLSLGSDGIGVGVNVTFGYAILNGLNIGLNFGATYYLSAAGTEKSGFEGRLGYGIGYKGKSFQAGIGSTYFFSGETSQQTGSIYVGGGNWRLTYENDTWAPVPGLFTPGTYEKDKYRTAALRFDITGGKLKGVNAGLNIFTGKAENIRSGTYIGGTADKYRMGVIYIGYNQYRIGYNSERNIRGPIQNGFHDKMGVPHFRVLSLSDRFYYGIYSSNPYTLW